MPQASDIELDGVGYMAVPGSYKRASDGWPEGRLGRVLIKDYFGGQRQAMELARDRAWDAAGVGPALMGQGVEPWPYTSAHADGVVPAADKTLRMPIVVCNGYVWLGYGRYLYKSIAITAGAWASFLNDEDFGAGVSVRTMAAMTDTKLAVCFGPNKDIQIYDTTAGTASTLRAGRKANCVAGYGGYLIFGGQDDVTIRIDNGTNQASRDLDGKPLQMALHDGQVAIATRGGSLFLFGGRWDSTLTSPTWVGEPEPFFTHGVYADDQDYKFLLSYGGKLYTWLMGEVMEFNPNAGASRQGWRAIGLQGRSCYGATVAGNMLIVTVVGRSGNSEVWAWDGSGWWLIRSMTPGNAVRCFPAYLGGAANLDLLVFRDGAAYDLYRLVYRSETDNTYNSAGDWVSSMLDAGERDKTKAWRKVGCSFAAPEIRGNSASVDSVTLTLSYSIDGGKTFTTAATTSSNDPTTRVIDLEATLSNAAAVSRFIQLRVSWSSVLDWAPMLTGAWAEYELLDSPARRRRWTFKVDARDGSIKRDSSKDSRSGRQIINALWADWSAGTTVTFRDLDYDDVATTYQVRIVGISEEVPKPSDAGRFGDSIVSLTLVEI